MLNSSKQKLISLFQLFTKLPKLHRQLILGLCLVCVLLLLAPVSYQSGSTDIALPALADPEYVAAAEQTVVQPNIPDYEWIVEDGDTLGELFSLFNLSYTMSKILEADKNILSLDVINKGDKYRFWLRGNDDSFDGKDIVLTRMEQVLGIEHQVVFQRNGDGFEYQETILPGIWKQRSINGVIKSGSSFYQSAVAQGLPANDVSVINRLLKSKLDFSRHTAAGDKFQVVLSSQYIGDIKTGNTKVEGVRFFNRKKVYSAFSFKDNYFDSAGDGLERAFSRYPVNARYRVSSRFNPRRKHPITGLIRPHNGTDFATPKGTSIYAPGDGVVKRVVRHKYAGLYVEIQHSYKYRTRYLHLSKSLVRKGQRVKRGQKIALSGNTGASTGAHLHYEFHVNQKPINAMGNKVPVVIGVDRKSMLAYKKRVTELIKLMESETLTKVNLNADNSG